MILYSIFLNSCFCDVTVFWKIYHLHTSEIIRISPIHVVSCSQSQDAYQLEIISARTYNLLLVKTVSGHIVIIMWLQTVIYGMLGWNVFTIELLMHSNRLLPSVSL